LLPLCATANAALRHIPQQLLKKMPTQFAPQGHNATAAKVIPISKAASDGTAPKAYGVRIYSDAAGNSNAIVSFDVDNPAEIKEEMPLDGYTIRGGVCVDGIFYLIDAPEFIAYRLLAVDINTKQIKTIATYEGLSSPEAALIITDMTYDPSTGNVYLLAYDLQYDDTSYGEDQFALGLFTLNIKTGLTTAVGYQYYNNFVTIAASADGDLFGLDDEGTLWLIDKTTGVAEWDLCYITDLPSSLQSMSFDHDSGLLYWSGFFVEQDGDLTVGRSSLYSFTMTDDGAIPTCIGSLQDNAEIVGLYIDSDPLPKSSPSSVTELSVTRGANGSPTVTLGWNNPQTTVGGDALEAGFEVNIYRNDALVATIPDQNPGASVSYTDENVPPSMVIYKVIGQNDSGEGRAAYTDSLYVGRDVPGKVGNLAVEHGSEGYDVTLNWTKPTNGANKGWFDEATISYTITRYPDGKTLADGITDTTFTDHSITELHGYYYSVTPINADGAGTAAISSNIVAGPPIEQLPYSCDFATDEQVRLWTIVDNDHDGQTWYVSSNYAGVSDSFLKYFPDQELNPEKEADDWFISAPISLKASKHYIVRYDIRLMGTLFPCNYTIAAGADATPESQTLVIAKPDSVINDMEFETKTATFTVPADGIYHIGFQARNAVSAHFANITIEEVPETDMKAVSIKGFTAIPMGSATTYKVEIMNHGGSTAKEYDVSIIDNDGNSLATKHFDTAIEPQATDTVAISWTPEAKGEVTIRARVRIDGDEDNDNDVTPEPLAVTITGQGAWHHVAEGTDRSMFTPFRLPDKHSTTMTIYTKAELKPQNNQNIIAGIAFYYYIYKENPLVNHPIKIYMANTDLPDWGDDKRISESDWTLVYDGPLSCPVGSEAVQLLFGTSSFAYTGKNLAVMCVQSGQGGNTKVTFFYNRHKEEDTEKGRLLLNYGSDPYTFGDDEELLMWNDVANASFLFTNGTSGISSLEADGGNKLAASYHNGTLTVAGECDHIAVFDLAGRRVAEQIGSNTVPMSHCAKGTYIVSASNGDHIATTKIVIR